LVVNGTPFPALPIRFNWAGWEATTLDLQRAGWEILMETDHHRYVRCIYLQHKQNKVICHAAPIPEEWLHELQGDFNNFPILKIQQVSIDVLIRRHEMSYGEVTFSKMAEVTDDTIHNSYLEENYSIKEIFSYFSKPAEVIQLPKEIIVPEKGVDELLEQILELQKPQRNDYIQRKVKEGIPSLKTTHANIISLVG
jgi:hypothetical protein